MKIKCPHCSTLLQVADSAAGKVVKCQCGKQLRLPAVGASAASQPGAASRPGAASQPGAATASRPNAAARPGTGAGPGVGARSAPANPRASGGGFFDVDAAAFDELTDSDMKPIRGVETAAPAYPSPGPARAATNPYGPTAEVAPSDSKRKPGERPGTLTFLGVVNGFWTVLYLLGVLVLFGLTAFFADFLAEDLEAGAAWGLLVFGAVFAAACSLAITVACFVPKPACWYIVVFGYAFYFGDRVMGLVGAFQEDEAFAKLLTRSIVGLVVGLVFWAYLHGEEARAFYGVPSSRLKLAAIPDAIGLLIGLGLGAAIIFA